MAFSFKEPNINTGKPWSEMDDQDLLAYFSKGAMVKHKAVAQAAEFLCRNQVEVRQRLRELGYIRSRSEAARVGNRKRLTRDAPQ
jgi:hypothetical protein